MRVFFAVEIPDSVASSVRNVRDTIQGIRWIPFENVHLTLHFLGEQPEERVSDAILAGSEPSVHAFDLRLSGVGAFPGVRRPSVLWAGIDDAECLEHLHAAVGKTLRNRGFKLEDRVFRPHVTIGRVRRGGSVDVSEWAARHTSFRSDTFQITAFHLIASKLRKDGPSYSPVASFPLIS